jgi:hypothetical protein
MKANRHQAIASKQTRVGRVRVGDYVVGLDRCALLGGDRQPIAGWVTRLDRCGLIDLDDEHSGYTRTTAGSNLAAAWRRRPSDAEIVAAVEAAPKYDAW